MPYSERHSFLCSDPKRGALLRDPVFGDEGQPPKTFMQNRTGQQQEQRQEHSEDTAPIRDFCCILTQTTDSQIQIPARQAGAYPGCFNPGMKHSLSTGFLTSQRLSGRREQCSARAVLDHTPQTPRAGSLTARVCPTKDPFAWSPIDKADMMLSRTASKLCLAGQKRAVSTCSTPSSLHPATFAVASSDTSPLMDRSYGGPYLTQAARRHLHGNECMGNSLHGRQLWHSTGDLHGKDQGCMDIHHVENKSPPKRLKVDDSFLGSHLALKAPCPRPAESSSSGADAAAEAECGGATASCSIMSSPCAGLIEEVTWGSTDTLQQPLHCRTISFDAA